MRRTFPLLITGITGFVMIASAFIPATENWGEEVSIWFDLLAAMAFVLGGGNLLKIHLKKISDRAAGWGYSAVIIVSFIVTLVIGLGKIGVPPSPDQEFHGETFVTLPLEQFPAGQTFRVAGTIPEQGDGEELPANVRLQLREDGEGQLVFRGWMSPAQAQELTNYDDTLEWQAAVEELAEKAAPPESLKGQISYHANHQALSVTGPMGEEVQAELSKLGDDPAWRQAVEELARLSRQETSRQLPSVPPVFAERFTSPSPSIKYDVQSKTLTVTGPMNLADRDALANDFGFFPPVQPMLSEPLDPQATAAQLPAAAGELWDGLKQRGPLSPEQLQAFVIQLNATYVAQELIDAVNAAGQGKPTDRTARELLADKNAGVKELALQNPAPPDSRLSPRQQRAIENYLADPAARSFQRLLDELQPQGNETLTAAQRREISAFLKRQPTRGDWKRQLGMALLAAGELTDEQQSFLFSEYRQHYLWKTEIGALYLASQQTKYPWSGEYQADGSAFWWIYEYVFKPLTATMFSLLAFYVASAAFRAFRAKNLEATLLLGTAFIILLGRTFAGVWLTDWMPESLSGLRIENLSQFIAQVFNTAGSRAIMIGIALGLASTSLKVLLGIDRSYLGSGGE